MGSCGRGVCIHEPSTPRKQDTAWKYRCTLACSAYKRSSNCCIIRCNLNNGISYWKNKKHNNNK